jgi:hypothetical protein
LIVLFVVMKVEISMLLASSSAATTEVIALGLQGSVGNPPGLGAELNIDVAHVTQLASPTPVQTP